MKKNTKSLSALSIVLIVSVFSFSCAKTPSGIRTVKQTGSNIVNPQTSSLSTQAASNQNLLYQMTVVELPGEAVDGSFTVNSEIKTPSGQFIPITTTHTVAQPNAYGVLNDANNGAQLDIRSRCIGDKCDKYVMLVTVVVSNYAVHQMAIISNLNQDKFNLENLNTDVTKKFYTSLDDVLARNPGL